jgi:hypothetical protein
MRGAIHPLPSTSSWCGAQLKAQGQLYFYLIVALISNLKYLEVVIRPEFN